MNLPRNPLLATWTTFWEARNARERSVLTIAGGLLLLLLVWLWLIDPALQGRAQLKKSLPALHAQLAQLQALTKEAAALPAASSEANSAGTTSASTSSLSRSLLESSLARKGMKAQTLEINGELVQMKFSGVSFAALIAWLGEMQAAAQLAVNDATVVALTQSDKVDASLSLRQQR
jgi:general secretion pathway protein M